MLTVLFCLLSRTAHLISKPYLVILAHNERVPSCEQDKFTADGSLQTTCQFIVEKSRLYLSSFTQNHPGTLCKITIRSWGHRVTGSGITVRLSPLSWDHPSLRSKTLQELM